MFYYEYLINNGWMLINDCRLTKDSEKIWNKLIQKYPAKIVDIKTLTLYNFDEVGNKTDEGITILHPKEDTAGELNQRWYYVVGKNIPD